MQALCMWPGSSDTRGTQKVICRSILECWLALLWNASVWKIDHHRVPPYFAQGEVFERSNLTEMLWIINLQCCAACDCIASQVKRLLLQDEQVSRGHSTRTWH